MKLLKYEGNRKGVVALFQLPGVSALLLAKGENVAAAARAQGQMMSSDDVEGPGTEVELPIEVELNEGFRPTVSIIADHPGALAAERKNRILGSAMDAAGG